MKRVCGDAYIITVESCDGVDVFECSCDEAVFVKDFLCFIGSNVSFKRGVEE